MSTIQIKYIIIYQNIKKEIYIKYFSNKLLLNKLALRKIKILSFNKLNLCQIKKYKYLN